MLDDVDAALTLHAAALTIDLPEGRVTIEGQLPDSLRASGRYAARAPVRFLTVLPG